ncbi:WD40 domain-containing protein [Oryctes borbonicus]|uniref:WD40 domain-containing protein n=1 Tax=Oryctes borbonicus TaxID=1629725 RepID=A0A0T6AUI7_9SCAR|nr:WD40 domain-containing protein [Oryctes borbonicus]
MNNNYELLSKKETSRTNVDLIKTLERRCGGYILNPSSSLYDLEVLAEDVFVKKQFDELRCEMPGTPRSTFLMVFSPDGSKVASTHGNHNIYVTDVRSGKNIKTLIGHPRTPWCIAFHPTSNQILASGCLGGQVRIWDLSGGSETWTSEIPTVIASIAFHPDDRLLVIATYNELYFWDWSKPEPFMHVATGSIKEKVRYVAFDKLGQKLITGISNSPQTRWERVRTAVPVPRQVDRSANPYRRRITPRLISSIPSLTNSSENVQSTSTATAREPLTTVPERERRITACYRNLVREYELLVHRYLQIYRPPTMIDQGTDPMEIDLSSIAGSSNSSESTNPGNSQSRTSASTSTESVFPASTYHSFNSLVNDANHRVSTASTNPLSGILFDTTSRMNSSQGSPLSRLCTSVNDSYNATLGSSSNTIELTAFPETSDRPINFTTSQNSTASINSVSPSSQILDSAISNLRNDTLTSNSQEVRLSPNTVRNVSSEKNENLTKNISGQNSVPNLPNCSYTFRKLHQQNNSNDSELPENVSNTSTNICERLLSDSAIQEEPLHSLDNSVLLDSTPFKTNKTQVKKEQFDSKVVDLPTSSSKRNSLSGQSTTTKLKTQSPTSLNNLTNLNSDMACEVLRGTIHVPRNIIDAVHQTNLQNRERCVEYVESNKKNMSKRMEQDDTSKETRLGNQNTLQDSSLFDLEPRPSTSGFRATPFENYDDSNSGVNSKLYLPKQDNTKFYEHTRKRDYPSLLKKNRRPFIDSSSDSSSEEELATKRLRTAKLCSLSCRTPNVNTTHRPSDITNNSGPSSSNNNNTGPAERPLNFNRELEVLVTDLLMDNEHTQNPTSSNTFNASKNGLKSNVESGARQTCGESFPLSTSDAQCSSTTATDKTECSTSTENSGSQTPSSAIYTQPGNHRLNRSGRFFSHRVSAFYPTRIQNFRPFSRLRRSNGYLSPTVRNRLRILNTLENPSRLGAFALDEVINYSERVATEDIPESDIGFHPFDPPPEVASINPENIGIGNMYSNIVQELESSLNDVRNIRASSRLGETSDMLSSFSERLESIMNQSNTILRNLRTSIDILQPNHQNVTAPASDIDPTQPSSTRTNQPRILFSDSSFYLREQTNNQTSDGRSGRPTTGLLERSTSQDEYTNHNGSSSVAFDHTYPLNSRNSDSTVSNMSPLMVSLHLTVSHIQRQARLLRQQVESIERIDRAMLEVAQLQMMRQMFIEMQCYFRAIQCNENRSSLSRVRQMMAGTRISDSSPYDSPNDDSNENSSVSREDGISNSTNNPNLPQSSTVARGQTRKTYPRCMFLMQRYFRRGSAGNIFQRRCLSRERVIRRHSFRRSILSIYVRSSNLFIYAITNIVTIL